jgi:hypothetical protein
VFVTILFYLQKKKEIEIREFVKKMFLIMGFDVVAVVGAVVLSIFILPLGLSHAASSAIPLMCAIFTFWLLNTLFVKVNFQLGGTKADIITIVVSLTKVYIHFFTPFSLLYILLVSGI